MNRARGMLAVLTILAAWAGQVVAQGPGGTDIYLARLSSGDGTPRLSEPVNITARVGYDNQPSFSPDGSLVYYTSYRDGQADTYVYAITSGTTRQVTNTPESEYSPTVTPAGDRFSVVRVEQDSTQRLWTFALDGSDPQLLIPSVAPVGYHAWLSEEIVALFVLGSPNTLQVFHALAGSPMWVADNVGRTLTRHPTTGDLTFLQHTEAGERWVTIQDTESGAFRRIAITPANEFFAWTSDGILLSGDASKVLAYRGEEGRWLEIADFGSAGLTEISRIAVSRDGTFVAFVAAEGG